jgi:Cu/Ag efflux protein CusF
MPAMTMVFRLGNPAMLNEVKPGYAMRFRANRVKGSPSITQMETKSP